jgi:hypothetical protein
LKCRLSAAAVEKLLHAHMGEGQVRYSQFPGRQSLDLLWGHRDAVGTLAHLWDTRMDAEKLREEVGDFEEHHVADDAEWVFLSHSFLDIEGTRLLREFLLERGYGVWMAETHVPGGESIVQQVQEGLENADRFALYATRRSLGSRWVLKEGGLAVRRWKLPATLIVDSSDEELVEAVRAWVESGWNIDALGPVAALMADDPIDPVAPTPLESLLISVLGEADAGTRSVVLFPTDAESARTTADERWFRALEEAFPSS